MYYHLSWCITQSPISFICVHNRHMVYTNTTVNVSARRCMSQIHSTTREDLWNCLRRLLDERLSSFKLLEIPVFTFHSAITDDTIQSQILIAQFYIFNQKEYSLGHIFPRPSSSSAGLEDPIKTVSTKQVTPHCQSYDTVYFQVRSLELDVKAWTDDMVSVFHQIGNKRANQYFEKHLNEAQDPRPPPNGAV